MSTLDKARALLRNDRGTDHCGQQAIQSLGGEVAQPKFSIFRTYDRAKVGRKSLHHFIHISTDSLTWRMSSVDGPTKEAVCYKATAQKGPPLFQNGKLIIQTHHIGWIVSGVFTTVATIVSFWLISKHLRSYTNKREQRYIVRILFMVPIYAIISFASFLFWNHSTPLLLIRDGYESTVLTAFFYLLLMYISPDPEEQRSTFLIVGLSQEADKEAKNKGEEAKGWIFPLGFIKSKPEDGLYFLQMMKWGVLQYCVIRPITTLIAVILNYLGLYCEDSWGLGWGHIYVTIIVSISVTVAMYCLIQLYLPIAQNIAPHRPLLKLFAIKAVVFLTFWQSTFLSLLSIFGVIKDTQYMTAADVNIGIGALLETFEMMLFAFLHIRAFTYRPYQLKLGGSPTHTSCLPSLGHAMDFRETLREIWTGCVYIFDRMRGREPTPDVGARRVAHYERAFGRSRPSQLVTRKLNINQANREKSQPALPSVEIEVDERVDVDIEGERQWLGVGNDYGYGLGYITREKSDGLAVQIDRELQTRGYTTDAFGDHIQLPLPKVGDARAPKRRERSWWRSIYHRISHSGPEPNQLNMELSRMRRQHSRSRPPPVGEDNQGLLFEYGYDLNDLPPQSVARASQSQHPSGLNILGGQHVQTIDEGNILAPLVPVLREARSHYQNLPYGSASSYNYHNTDHPPARSTRSDSLLGRIFPRITENEIAEYRGHNGSPPLSPLSASTTEAPQLQTRLISSTPDIMFRTAHQKTASQPQFQHPTLPAPLTAEVIDTPFQTGVIWDAGLPPRKSLHSRESAIHHPSPPLHLLPS